jgi:hypothetical protein
MMLLMPMLMIIIQKHDGDGGGGDYKYDDKETLFSHSESETNKPSVKSCLHFSLFNRALARVDPVQWSPEAQA